MIKLKFVHTADLHLDTPFKGLSEWNPLLAGKLKDATYKSFSNIIDLCIAEEVDFLIVAGDIFDSESSSLAAQIRFIDELKRLSGMGIQTYFLCGNHDYLGSWVKNFSLPEGVFRFGSESVERFTFSRNGSKIADIYGISYETSHISENLVPQYLKGENPAPFSIAVLHGMADIVGRDENCAPFRVKDILSRPFDYWALGHVHAARVLSRDPLVVYPGNPQGRDFGEKGPKGCTLVEMTSGMKPEVKFVPVQQVRFEDLEIDLTGHNDITILKEVIEEGKSQLAATGRGSGLILRISLVGRTELHKFLNKPGESVQFTHMLNEGQLERDSFSWVDSITVKTSPPADIDRLRNGTDFTAEMIRNIERYETDKPILDDIINKLQEELPLARIFKEMEGFTENEKKDILEHAKWLLIDNLPGDTSGGNE
ncbi:MAG: exonuclease SbcCD subunit D [Bacteroidales bacterium]